MLVEGNSERDVASGVGISESAVTQPRRLSALSTRACEHAGRAILVFVPVISATIFATDWSAGHAIAASLVLGSFWYAGISVGVATGRTTLATLGPWVAVARGTIFGFIAVTVVGVWSSPLMPGDRASLATGVAVLILVGAWESVFVERLTPPKRLLSSGRPKDA